MCCLRGRVRVVMGMESEEGSRSLYSGDFRVIRAMGQPTLREQKNILRHMTRTHALYTVHRCTVIRSNSLIVAVFVLLSKTKKKQQRVISRQEDEHEKTKYTLRVLVRVR